MQFSESVSSMQLIWQSATTTLSVEQLHPCTLNSQFCLVHHPDLPRVNHSLFTKLQALARKNRWRLKTDQRRSGTNSNQIDRRRRPWIPILLLSTCLSSTAVSADDSITRQLKALQAPTTTEHQTEHESSNPPIENIARHEDPYWSDKIAQTLIDHWQKTNQDPPDLQADLRRMATYYSQFPDVRELLLRLEQADWTLKFSKQNYSTDIIGKRLIIESVAVNFDPSSAAQFKFQKACSRQVPYCISSPADVLLHELIHVDLALNQTELFLQQGGLSSNLYPHEHERHTIQLERLLYQAMTEIDHLPRPIRSEHVGRHVAVNCATCLPQFSSR